MATGLTSTESLLLAVGVLALGLALLFFGYRIFRVLIVMVGALVGWLMGQQIPTYTLWWSIGLALVGALLVLWLYRAGVFLVGATVGFFIAVELLQGRTFGSVPDWVIPLVAAVAGGALALWFERPAIIVATAFDGAYSAWVGGFALFGADMPAVMLSLLAIVIMAAVGALVQMRYTARASR